MKGFRHSTQGRGQALWPLLVVRFSKAVDMQAAYLLISTATSDRCAVHHLGNPSYGWHKAQRYIYISHEPLGAEDWRTGGIVWFTRS